MKYIIMCGGKYEKWKTPKHLVEIHGEPLVARTIRLLRESGAEDIAISSNDDRFAALGVPLIYLACGKSVRGGRCAALNEAALVQLAPLTF